MALSPEEKRKLGTYFAEMEYHYRILAAHFEQMRQRALELEEYLEDYDGVSKADVSAWQRAIFPEGPEGQEEEPATAGNERRNPTLILPRD